ncbi:hypothetical protein [Ralstonia pseudosolanacearum]|uniref:hypothetical protein n=1 Tax=Ralstonia pseudosolanacearum TaxID=1310165 RepID=UPI002012FBC0|nr:hypothetical protein [Ralstonia pseudosolanacearum]MCL1618043.1 hypothetical protein [Ralstonia pseudosolanacearum CaRs-Mep]
MGDVSQPYQEHALICTAGNHANGSATINADGNLTIAAAQINNRNNHFATADQTSAGIHVTFYRLASTASAQQHDGMASY